MSQQVDTKCRLLEPYPRADKVEAAAIETAKRETLIDATQDFMAHTVQFNLYSDPDEKDATHKGKQGSSSPVPAKGIPIGSTGITSRDILITVKPDLTLYMLIQEEKRKQNITREKIYSTMGGCAERWMHPVTGKVVWETDGEAVQRETWEESNGIIDLRNCERLGRDEDTDAYTVWFLHKIQWRRPAEAPRELPREASSPFMLPRGNGGNYALASPPPPPPRSSRGSEALYGEEIDLSTLENNESTGHQWIPVRSFLKALRFVHLKTGSTKQQRYKIIESASRDILDLDGSLLTLNLRRESPIFKKLMSLAGSGL